MSRYEFQDYRTSGTRKSKFVEVDKDHTLHKFLMSFYDSGSKETFCKSSSPERRWTCTRRGGHAGPHMGHNSNGLVGIWDREDSDPDEGEDEYPTKEVQHNVYDPHGWLPSEEEDEDD